MYVGDNKTDRTSERRSPDLMTLTTAELLIARTRVAVDGLPWPLFAGDHLSPAPSVKVIYGETARRDRRLAQSAAEIGAVGAEVRVTRTWLPDMVISDRRIAFLSGDLTDPADDSLWTAHRPLSRSFLASSIRPGTQRPPSPWSRTTS